MLITNALRQLALAIASLLGLLIVAGIFVWIDILNELFNPAEIVPLEDKYLWAGLFISVYYFAAVIEAIAVAALTRHRWIPFNRGKISVRLLSLLGLLQVLFYVWMINDIRGLGGNYWALILLIPFGFACVWSQRTTNASLSEQRDERLP